MKRWEPLTTAEKNQAILPRHVTLNVSHTLHYSTVHYITLQYITVHYSALHNDIRLHYIELHSITLHYIILHFMPLYDYIHYNTYSIYIYMHTYKRKNVK